MFFFRLFFWIKFETLRIFFDLWFCVFAQRTRRSNDVVWIVNFSKIFLNFNFFFLTMIFFLTSMNFIYVFQFFSIRKNDYSLRFLLIVVTIFEHLKLQKNCARFDFLIMRIASWMINCTLSWISLTKVLISLRLLKDAETTKARRQNVNLSLSIFFQVFFFDRRLLDLQCENRKNWYVIRRLIQISSAFIMRYVCLQSFNYENQIDDVTRIFCFSCNDSLRQTQIHMFCWRANRLIDQSLSVELNESNHFIKNDEDWNLFKKTCSSSITNRFCVISMMSRNAFNA